MQRYFEAYFQTYFKQILFLQNSSEKGIYRIKFLKGFSFKCGFRLFCRNFSSFVLLFYFITPLSLHPLSYPPPTVPTIAVILLLPAATMALTLRNANPQFAICQPARRNKKIQIKHCQSGVRGRAKNNNNNKLEAEKKTRRKRNQRVAHEAH